MRPRGSTTSAPRDHGPSSAFQTVSADPVSDVHQTTSLRADVEPVLGLRAGREAAAVRVRDALRAPDAPEVDRMKARSRADVSCVGSSAGMPRAEARPQSST